jgi:hypothetical protein
MSMGNSSNRGELALLKPPANRTENTSDEQGKAERD